MGAVCDRWLGCCCCFSGGEPKEATLQFVPASRRNCTDVLLLLLYIASWVGLIVTISIAAARGGDPNKIFHGVNYNGSICGSSAGVTDKPYAAWVALPNSPSSITNCANCSQIMTCVSSCDETNSGTNPYILDLYPSERLMYYCIPVISTNISFPYSSDFESASSLASRAFTDLYVVWPVIVVAPFVAVVFAFMYAWLSSKFSGVLVLVCICLVATGGFLMSYSLLKLAADADSTSVSDRATAMKVIGYIIVAVTVIFLIIVVALRQRIYIAIEVVKEASRAVMETTGLVVFPLLPFFLGLGYFVLFIATTLYIGSVWVTTTVTGFPSYIGNRLPGTGYQTYTWDQSLKNDFAFVFFQLLWTVQFLIYFTFIVISGTIANWYFTPRDAKGEKIRGDGEGQLSRIPVLSSLYRAVRFHLGTVAFGSLIIAVIMFIRAMVKYIEETSTPKSGVRNSLQKALFCCVQCCLWCVQCCLDKISKNALVWTAIYGDPFLQAAGSSFALIWSNLARAAALTMVGAFIMFVGKLLVAFITTGIAAVVILKAYNSTVNSLVLPVIVIFILTYLTAALFMSLLDTTIYTIFLCFLVDEKYNKASNTMLASEGLLKVINSHAELSKQLAEREQQKAGGRTNLGPTPNVPAATGSAAAPQVGAVPTSYNPPPAYNPAANPNAMQLSSAPTSFT